MSDEQGTKIGRYTLLELIGEGRNSLIFSAAQVEPLDRLVALKLIKPGMDSREVVARFEAERQSLAMMDHPNIVRLLDAGATQSGRPYFVMELIGGIPITDFCDQNRLSLNERLSLFANLCHAIQHIHQKGIIHRDVEPSNVLVTAVDGKPFPKLIDFGVAKAASSSLIEPHIVERFPPQIIAEPAYMSLEQAWMSPLNVDSRSDIYSLGALLYELLTGSTPIEKERFAGASEDEIRGLLRDFDPPKPSDRASAIESRPDVAASRKTSPTKLSTLLRGKVDCIVMKAIEKDRDRRYQNAEALAQDIERYLSGKRVFACPPPFADRIREFFRRGKRTTVTD